MYSVVQRGMCNVVWRLVSFPETLVRVCVVCPYWVGSGWPVWSWQHLVWHSAAWEIHSVPWLFEPTPSPPPDIHQLFNQTLTGTQTRTRTHTHLHTPTHTHTNQITPMAGVNQSLRNQFLFWVVLRRSILGNCHMWKFNFLKWDGPLHSFSRHSRKHGSCDAQWHWVNLITLCQLTTKWHEKSVWRIPRVFRPRTQK